MIKVQIVETYRAMGKVPYMAVHDETDHGVNGEKQAKEIQKIAEECMDLCVPIRADLTLGKHWK
jgi:DNA polymerase I-like protein with 3'-5' exonuclease and polymerase domains